jgi:hypothetical protein
MGDVFDPLTVGDYWQDSWVWNGIGPYLEVNNSVKYKATLNGLTIDAIYGFGKNAGSVGLGSTYGMELTYAVGPASLDTGFQQTSVSTAEGSLVNGAKITRSRSARRFTPPWTSRAATERLLPTIRAQPTRALVLSRRLAVPTTLAQRSDSGQCSDSPIRQVRLRTCLDYRRRPGRTGGRDAIHAEQNSSKTGVDATAPGMILPRPFGRPFLVLSGKRNRRNGVSDWIEAAFPPRAHLKPGCQERSKILSSRRFVDDPQHIFRRKMERFRQWADEQYLGDLQNFATLREGKHPLAFDASKSRDRLCSTRKFDNVRTQLTSEIKRLKHVYEMTPYRRLPRITGVDGIHFTQGPSQRIDGGNLERARIAPTGETSRRRAERATRRHALRKRLLEALKK